MLKFHYDSFTCDIDTYYNDQDIIVRFYDSSKEQKVDEIVNLVIVDPGYGYLHLKYKGDDSALLSGLLDEDVFKTDELVDAAINFIEYLSPDLKSRYVPYHIDRFKKTSFVEYNGEY